MKNRSGLAVTTQNLGLLLSKNASTAIEVCLQLPVKQHTKCHYGKFASAEVTAVCFRVLPKFLDCCRKLGIRGWDRTLAIGPDCFWLFVPVIAGTLDIWYFPRACNSGAVGRFHSLTQRTVMPGWKNLATQNPVHIHPYFNLDSILGTWIF